MEVTSSPVAVRRVMMAPEFVRDRLPVEAFTTCEPPKTELGMVGEPPPKMTIAVPAPRIVPGAKRWRRVSRVVVRERVWSS